MLAPHFCARAVFLRVTFSLNTGNRKLEISNSVPIFLTKRKKFVDYYYLSFEDDGITRALLVVLCNYTIERQMLHKAKSKLFRIFYSQGDMYW